MTEASGAFAAIPPPGSVPLTVAKLHWRWDAANTVVLLASLLIFVIVAIFVFLCFQGYATTVEGAKTKAQAAADVVASDVDIVLDGAHTALSLAAHSIGNASETDIAAQKASFEGMLAPLARGAQIAFYDASGAVLPGGAATSLPANMAGTTQMAALAASDGFTVLPQGTDPTGAPIIVIGQKLSGTAAGGFALLSLPGTILETYWAPQRLGADSTVNVHLESGEMVGRFPPLAKPVNATVSPAWPQISANQSGTYSAQSPIDQVTRVVGFRHIADLGIVVFATISEDALMAGLWNSILIVSFLIGPIAIALLIGALITASLLRRSAQTQASLTVALEHNEVLFREIHHRVKNNLQSVASLLQMQPIPADVKLDMGQRIAAMSAVHEHIYRSNNFSSVRVKDYLTTLIENIRGGHDLKIKVIEEFDDIAVDKDAATPLGLIVNEVVANAFKHAFKDGRDGVIEVRLVRLENGEGCLTVEDNGVGFDPATPAKGIGRRLVAALTQQLGGQSGFSTNPNGGSRFTLTFSGFGG